MDLGHSKSITPLGSSMESRGPRINKNAFRRFQNFLARKRFKMPVRSRRLHRAGGIGLLRAAVLGANDGIVSTSSLLIGVAAAHGTHRSILVAGIAGLVSGGMSMAASEYVSVHSQADTEEAELALERTKLKQDNKSERQALTAIYVARGLEPLLANQVAQQLIAYDELGAYARDELGISEKIPRAPIAGFPFSCMQLCSWSHDATHRHCDRTRGAINSYPLSIIAGSSRSNGRTGRTRWWRKGDDGRNTRDVLGRSGDDDDRWHRVASWGNCVMKANERHCPKDCGSSLPT